MSLALASIIPTGQWHILHSNSKRKKRINFYRLIWLIGGWESRQMSCHLLAQLIETILQPSSTIHAVYITAVQDQLSHQMNVSSFLGVISLFIEGKSSWTAVYKASRDSPPPFLRLYSSCSSAWWALAGCCWLSLARIKEKKSRMRKLFLFFRAVMVHCGALAQQQTSQPRRGGGGEKNNGRKAYLVFAIIYNKIHFGVLPSTRRRPNFWRARLSFHVLLTGYNTAARPYIAK